MKYASFFMLALMSWNTWGMTFICKGGQEEYSRLKHDIQTAYEQNYSDESKATLHMMITNCQMVLGDSKGALQSLQNASDLRSIEANFTLARYHLTGGWGTAEKNRDKALLEFEKTLEKINAIFADYPNTPSMADIEVHGKLYPNTLHFLIQEYTNKYLAEGYNYYDTASPAHYGDPTEAIERDQTHKNILNKLEGHVESCLADHEGQNMMTRARRFSDDIEAAYEGAEHLEKTFEQALAEYRAVYLKVKNGYCPHYEKLVEEIRKREAQMHAIALNCTPPSGQPTKQRPLCADIGIETEEFATFFIEEWLPQKEAIQRN